MTKPLLLIVNPRSARRATGENWPKLEAAARRLLPPFDVAMTERVGHASELAGEAAGKYETVVAVGGDGTINEVANGILDAGGETVLGVLPRGTGSDLVRTLGVPHDWKGAAGVLAEGRRRQIDVGRATFTLPDGEQGSRWFVNAAEVGFGAMVSEAVNHPARWLPGPGAFMWAIVTTMFRHHPSKTSWRADGRDARKVLLSNAWIANGRYSGGGILSAPRASIDDGLLDFIVVEHAGPLARLSGLPKLRSGKFIQMRQVTYTQGAQVAFESTPEQQVEVDGDVVGTTPASFEVAAGRLSVVAGR